MSRWVHGAFLEPYAVPLGDGDLPLDPFDGALGGGPFPRVGW